MNCWLINKESASSSHTQFIPMIFGKCGKSVNKITLFTSKCIQWIYRPILSRVVLFDVSCGVTSPWGCRLLACTVKTSRIPTGSVRPMRVYTQLCSMHSFNKHDVFPACLPVCLSVQVVLTHNFIQIYVQIGRYFHLLAPCFGRTTSSQFSQHHSLWRCTLTILKRSVSFPLFRILYLPEDVLFRRTCWRETVNSAYFLYIVATHYWI